MKQKKYIFSKTAFIWKPLAKNIISNIFPVSDTGGCVGDYKLWNEQTEIHISLTVININN